MELESGLNERTTKQGTRTSGNLGDREERLPDHRTKIDVGPRRARPLAPRHYPASHHRGDGLTKMVRPRPPSAFRTDAVRSAVRRAATRDNQGETRENHGKPSNRFRACRPRSPSCRASPRSPPGRGVGLGARSRGPAKSAVISDARTHFFGRDADGDHHHETPLAETGYGWAEPGMTGPHVVRRTGAAGHVAADARREMHMPCQTRDRGPDGSASGPAGLR